MLGNRKSLKHPPGVRVHSLRAPRTDHTPLAPSQPGKSAVKPSEAGNIAKKLPEADKLYGIHHKDDNIAEKRPQVIATILATFGGFSVGTVIGWFLNAETMIKQKINASEDDLAWIASIVTLGGLAYQIMTAVLLDRVGRKKTMICALPFLMLGWMLLAFGNHKILYLIAWFLTGLGRFTLDVVTPV